ncbi:LptA/OstA family protein [Candidatus Poribacteria bacterium]
MRDRRINLFRSMGIFFVVMAVLGLYFTCPVAAEASKTTHEYSADKMDYDKKSGVTVLEGNAKFRRSDDDYLYADQITMYRDVDTDEIIKLESVGKVEMKEKTMTATCEHSIFYEKENRIEFKGSIDKPAVVDSGDNRMEAPFIIYFRQEERISASGLLFSVEVKFQSDLDNGAILDGLRQEFSKNRITLSDSVVVSTEEADDRWSITDGDKVYTVKKGKDKLDILAVGSVRGHVTVEVKEDESAEESTEEK